MEISAHNGIGHSYSFDQETIRIEMNEILDMKENIFLEDYVAAISGDKCNTIV